uniref:USP domain-containing protein n=1 Tax=Meloidogyne incognita TaxID=6306 RepID=A0A914L354_MELIC
MTYKSSNSEPSTETETGGTGLTNPENSCYINSALQVLVNTPKFASLYYKNTLKPFINLQHPDGTK